MFKIANLDNEINPIFLASNSLYVLMQSEEGIMAAAMHMNAEALESAFNEMVDDAVRDYKSFRDTAYHYNDDLFKITTLTNFKDLFDVCIDIKKKEACEAAALKKKEMEEAEKNQAEEAAAQATAEREAEERAALAAVAEQIEKTAELSMNQTINAQTENRVEIVELSGVFLGESSGMQQKQTTSGKANGSEKPAKIQRRK